MYTQIIVIDIQIEVGLFLILGYFVKPDET